MWALSILIVIDGNYWIIMLANFFFTKCDVNYLIVIYGNYWIIAMLAIFCDKYFCGKGCFSSGKSFSS